MGKEFDRANSYASRSCRGPIFFSASLTPPPDCHRSGFSRPLPRNIFNVISGGFGTEVKAPSGDGATVGVHTETTADSVAQKMLMAKVSVV